MSEGDFLYTRRFLHQIEYLTLYDEVVETIHHLLDRGIVVPPMNVEKVNIVGAELLQACVDAEVHTLGIIPVIVHLLYDLRVVSLEQCGVLR